MQSSAVDFRHQSMAELAADQALKAPISSTSSTRKCVNLSLSAGSQFPSGIKTLEKKVVLQKDNKNTNFIFGIGSYNSGTKKYKFQAGNDSMFIYIVHQHLQSTLYPLSPLTFVATVCSKSYGVLHLHFMEKHEVLHSHQGEDKTDPKRLNQGHMLAAGGNRHGIQSL